MKNDNLIKGSNNSITFSHKINEKEGKENKLINEIIFKKYQIKKKLGNTSTIDIYEGISLENNQPVLIKFEKQSKEKIYLEEEAYNLYSFKGFGIPELIKVGKRGDNIILIESKKGRSLYELFLENNRKFSINEICLIGIQCIERLKWVHSKNFLHRNIKPENFLIGIDDPHVIYLQNFYLCQKYRSGETHQHIKMKYTKEIVGTERYGSINALRGLTQGRKDDLESLCYMLIYFILGRLPWQGIKEENEILKHEKLLKEKKNFNIDNYKKIPKDFCTLFKLVKNLNFEEEPKYTAMIKLLQNILNENQCFNYKDFFWINKDTICHGANIKMKKEGIREKIISKIERSTKSEHTLIYGRKVKNDDINLDNLGKFYGIDDDENVEEEEENNDSYREKTDYKVKIENNLLESNNEEQAEKNEEKEDEKDNEDDKDNDLNGSNSSINTKVYKLNGNLESVVKKDIINDNNINKNIDELKINTFNLSKKKSKTEKSNIHFNEIIQEEPLNEEEDENSIQENKNETYVNKIKEDNNNIIIDDKKIFKLFNSSYTNNIKQESTKESIQFNSKASDFKENNEKPGSIILVKNNSHENIKEEKMINEDNKNKNKDIKQIQNINKGKVKVSKKKENKFGQIMGPTESIKKRSNSLSNNNVKKVKSKDCIIF